MKPVSLTRVGEEGQLYFFVATEIEDGKVAGHDLLPDYTDRKYRFGEKVVDSIDNFPYGFDYIFYGDINGTIDFENVSERIIRNYQSLRKQ